MSQLMNHRIVIPQRGGPDVLQLIEEDAPHPDADEIRVKTLASGVSGHDTMLRRAWFPGFPKVPFTPGVDVVGVVDELGREAVGFEPGQVVAALLPTEGGYAELVCVPGSQALAVPPGVDPAEAVCVVANYLTAYTMLHRAAGVDTGERVLIHGVAGGVGSALSELSLLAGLDVYGTASLRNHDLLRSRGVKPIDYRNEDFVQRIRELTGDGVDVVFDPIGGARQLWRSYRALRPGGRLVWFGVAATSRAGMGVIPSSLFTRLFLSMIPDGKKAPMPPDVSKPNTWYRETLTLLLDYLAARKIDPLVAERIPLNQAVRAHELLDRGGNVGKVVLVASD